MKFYIFLKNGLLYRTLTESRIRVNIYQIYIKTLLHKKDNDKEENVKNYISVD